MAATVEELLVRIRADHSQYEAGLAQVQRTTDMRMAAVEARFRQANSHLYTSVSDTMVRINAALATVGAGLGVMELAGYADAWTRVTRAVDATNQVFGIQVASASRIAELAVETRSDLEATEKLYLRTAVAVSKLGKDVSVAETVTTTFAKALKLGAASTTEQKSAMEQFSQALQKGKLDGDEFRSIMENAGVVQQALIEKFKVSGSVLMDMAQKGKITAKDIIEALEQIRPAVDEAFDRAPTTLAESFVNLKTAITQYIGSAESANGVTLGLAAGIQSIAQNVDMLVKGAAAIAIALGLVFTPAAVAAVQTYSAALATAAVAAGPVGVGMATITAGIVAFTAISKTFGDDIDLIADKGITLGDVANAMGLEIRQFAASAFSFASGKATEAFDLIRQALKRSGSDAQATTVDIAGAVKSLANSTIGVFFSVSNTIAAMVTSVFGTLPSALVAALNKGLLQVQQFARSVAETLNAIPGFSIDVDAIKIAQIPDVFKQTADNAEVLWLNASKAMGRDYIGEMGAASDAVGRRLTEDALLFSKLRNQRQDDAQDAAMPKTSNTAPQPVYPDKPDENKYTKELEQIRKRTELLVAEAAAVSLSTAEQEKAKAVQMLLTAARQADVKITPEVTAAIEALATKYGEAGARLKFLQELQKNREDGQAQTRENALMGLYGQELYKARIEAELLAQARKDGVSLSEAERADIANIAAKNASLKQLNETMADVKDTANSALKSFITDLRNGKSATEALGSALNRIADKLIDMAAEQLVMGALGPLFGGMRSGGGLLSGIGSMFGGGGGAAVGGGWATTVTPAFAEGGVMTSQGPRSLNKYAGGGISNKAAIFGETGSPEAAVPLPDGRRIPVDLRMPDMSALNRMVSAPASGPSASVSVAPVFHIGGNVSATDLANLKREIAETLPNAVRHGVAQVFDRDPRFRRSGI